MSDDAPSLESAVRQAAFEAAELPGNPASVHAFGRRARAPIDALQAFVLEALSCTESHRLVLCAGVEEARALALVGCARAAAGRRIALAAGAPLPGLAEFFGVACIQPARDFAHAKMGQVVDSKDELVLALDEVKSFDPRNREALKSAASVALIIDFEAFGAAPGLVGLLLPKSLKVEPLWWGGGQQEGLRPGTECSVLAAGALAALLQG